jgi:hypothetical protein
VGFFEELVECVSLGLAAQKVAASLHLRDPLGAVGACWDTAASWDYKSYQSSVDGERKREKHVAGV